MNGPPASFLCGGISMGISVLLYSRLPFLGDVFQIKVRVFPGICLSVPEAVFASWLACPPEGVSDREMYAFPVSRFLLFLQRCIEFSATGTF